MPEVLVKICGMTRSEDVEAAAEMGADLVGFVIVPDSPRGIPIDRARQLAAAAPAGIRTVAVFAGPVAAEGAAEGFDLVQVYGLEGARPGAIVGLREPPPAMLPDDVPLLLDLPRGSTPGHDALVAHWHRAATVRPPVMLAGSLTPDNVAEAVRTARPWAVDTARGVEAEPGIKDHDRMRAFIRNAKEAA